MEWWHLPRDQIIGTNKRPAWVGRTKEDWLEGVHEAEKWTNQMTREKNFGELGLGEKTSQKFLHTCWSAQEDIGKKF